MWERWLKAQHHDAGWHGALILREKSRQWCAEMEKAAHEKMNALIGSEGKDNAEALRMISVFPLAQSGGRELFRNTGEIEI